MLRFAAAWTGVSVSDDGIASDAIAGDGPTWTLPRGDAGATGAVTANLPENLEVIWEHPTAEAIETTPVSDGKRVYVSDVMGGIEALDLTDGSQVWRKDLDTGFVASPAIHLGEESNSVLVVGDVEGNVYALSTADGETIWKQTTDGEINASANFFQSSKAAESTAPDSTAPESTAPRSTVPDIRVLQTSQDGSLYCFALKTGELIWKYETGDQIRCAASIGDGKTYLGGCDAGLHVVDLETGEAAREPLPLDGPTGSTPAIVGDEVFVPIMDGILYSFDPVAGTTRWQYEDADRPQDYRGSVAIGTDRIIIASRNKHIEAIDRATGKLIWRTTLRRRADASPLIVGDDVWIASTDGRLLRLSLADGSEKWSFEIKGGFFASPAVLGDRLIIADDEGMVRCFGAGQKP